MRTTSSRSPMRYGNKTPREWLIDMAVSEMRRIHEPDRLQAARLAMEAVTEGSYAPGTLGAAMRHYYLSATEKARERLDTIIARRAAR